jgi:hypothetical protein
MIRHDRIRLSFIFGLTVIFFLVSITPVLYQLKLDSQINVNNSVTTQCQYSPLFRLDNYILSPIALALVIFFMVNKIGTTQDNVSNGCFGTIIYFYEYNSCIRIYSRLINTFQTILRRKSTWNSCCFGCSYIWNSQSLRRIFPDYKRIIKSWCTRWLFRAYCHGFNSWVSDNIF